MQSKIYFYSFIGAILYALEIQVHSQIIPEKFRHDKLVVCYVTRWAAYREGAGKFDISDIDPSLCSHIIYCFMGLDEESNKIKSIDPWQDLEENYGKGGLKLMVGLKTINPYLKVSVAIGGWSEGSTKYSNMVADPKLRKIFVTSVILYFRVHNLDGFDIFWDSPTQRGGKLEDRQNFVLLCKELAEAFEPKNKLLTATLRPGLMGKEMNAMYDLVQLSFYLDYMHLMAFDYHGAWDGVVGANAPIRGIGDGDILNIEYTIKYLLSHDITPSKLILMMPMYGRTFLFKTPDVNEVVFSKTLTKTVGFSGPFTKENGFIGYNEICLELMNKSSGWVKYWDNHTVTPYLRDDTRFISYENTRSIANKVKLAIDSGFGGVAAWSITTDDFRSSCDEEMDTYVDFLQRFNRIADKPILMEALKNLTEANTQNKFYVLVNDKPRLRFPKPKSRDFPLLRTANEVISLTLEENRVLQEIHSARMIKEQRELKTETQSAPCLRICSEICF